MNNSIKIKNCVVQCRVSTNKQSQEGESLEVQENTIRKFVNEKNWDIQPNGKVWKTAISGRKTARDDFEEILRYIKLHPGFIQYYVFRSIDRATRAGTVEFERMKTELEKYGVEMIDTYGVIQPSKNTLADLGVEYSWSNFRPSEITESIMATNAKQELTTILTRMIGQEIRLTQQGYRARRSTDGYKNNKIFIEGKKKTIQVPDQERAKFYIAMFELRAQGLVDSEIVKRVNAMGYVSSFQNKYDKDHTKIIGKTGGIPLTIKQLQRVIENTIYAGVVCEKWTFNKPIRAQYEGLISIETFNHANKGKIAIIDNSDGTLELVRNNTSGRSKKTRMKHNPSFPFKFILCPMCDKPLLGSTSRGKSGAKFSAYHCTRNHKRYAINKKDFEENIQRYIKSLKFVPELTNGLEITFLKKYRIREKEIIRASGAIHQNIADLEIQQATKLEALENTKSSIVREKLEKAIEDLELKIKSAGKENIKIQISRDDIKAFMHEARKIMEHPAEILLNQRDLRVQRELFSLVFEKMPTYEEILNGTPKLSYVFKLSSEFKSDKNQLVTLQRIEL